MLEAQLCKIFDRHNLAGKEIVLSPKDARSSIAAHPTRRKANIARVNICIPTRNLQSYLVDTVVALGKTLATDQDELQSTSHVVSVTILSNGELQPEVLRHFVATLLVEDGFPVPLSLIHTAKPGKSNALNLLHQFSIITGAGQMIFLDDDICVAAGVLPKLCCRLTTGSPAFLGAPTTPVLSEPVTRTAIDIYQMSMAKRNHMGFPMPIGRFMAVPTALYPVITEESVNDDVFLSAHFYCTGVSQEVLKLDGVTYNVSTSLSEFIKRKRRISTSDQRIVELVPETLRSAFYKACIAPDQIPTCSDRDRAWRAIENDLYSFALVNIFPAGSEADLTETDLSSKPGVTFEHTPGGLEALLREELDRLKARHLGSAVGM